MARSSTMTSYSVSLNLEHAVQEIEKLKNRVKDLTDKMALLKQKMSDPSTWGPKDTKESLGKQYYRLEKDLDGVIKTYEQGVKRVKGIDSMLQDISGANYDTLTNLRTTLTNTLKRRKLGTEDEIKAYEEAAKRLQKVRDEITKRDIDVRGGMTEGRAKEVLAKPSDYSVKDIQEAVNVMTKLNSMQKENTNEWRVSNKLIQEGSKYLEEYNARMKQSKMEDLHMKVYDKSISDKDLETVIKYWESMAAGADKGSKQMDYYNKMLKESQSLLQQRSADKAKSVMANPAQYSVDEINAAIEATKKLQAAQKPGSDQWKEYGKQIQNAKNILNQFNSEAKTDAMTQQLKTPSSLSTNALAEQKKYWQEMINATDTMNPKLVEYKKNLEAVVAEERTRTQIAAEGIMKNAETGNWNKTIGETKEAIKQLQEYRNLLKTGDTAGLNRVDKILNTLTQKTKESEQGYISLSQALTQAGNLSSKSFKGTVADLEKLKKTLEEARRTKISVGDADGLRQVDNALFLVENKLKNTSQEAKTLDWVLGNIKSANFNQLQSAARVLEEKIKNTSTTSKEFIELSTKLKNVKSRMNELNKSWEGHGNVITKTAKRLAAYVAVYGGFNQIMNYIKQTINLTLQLSDSMADVQKTTGLVGVELQELGRELERLDTRTATAELYKLAAAAGQIGLKTQEDVLGFAKAANTISVALNELGAEGSASLMKIATLTGEVGRYGTEDALLKVGSAINELTANSAATAGPIADFISRVGGIASASKMAISDMAALGAAADASGQSIEIAGTSMNKLISALMSNTENIAYAANISLSELQGLIDQGETMQAIIRVFEAMQNMDRGSMNGLMKELGSEGARMNQYVASMVANLDLLKRQLAISSEAFDENVSVINEYNVKQESALGILQRMKNAFMDTFVNSKMTVILKDILETIASIPAWLEKNRAILLAIRVIIGGIIAYRFPLMLHTLLQSLSGLYRLLSGPVINVLTSFRAAWQRATFQVYLANRAMGASVAAATAATRGFKGFVAVVSAFVKANPLGVILTTVGATVAAWLHFREETDEVAKAMAELNQKHTRQVEELNALRAALDSTNASYAVKAAAMREINSLYSKYLGFELNELDTYEKKKEALDYINAKLKENQAMESESRTREVYTDQFTTDSKGSVEKLYKVFEEIPEITATRIPEAMEVMNNAIKNGATTYQAIIKELTEYFGTDAFQYTLSKQGTAQALKEYASYYSKYLQDINNIEQGYSNLRTQLQNKSNQELWELNKVQHERIQALQNDNSKRTEEEQRAHLKNLLKEQEEYLKTSETLFEVAKEQDLNNIQNSLNQDKMFNVESIRKNVSEATAARAEGMNKLREQMIALKQLQNDANKEVTDIETKLSEARTKENNDEEIRLLTQTLEDKKKLRHDYGQDIQRLEDQWQSEWVNLQTKNASEVKLQWLEVVQTTKNAIAETKAAIEGDPFGKLLNLKSWKGFDEIISPKALQETNASSIVNVYKKLREDYLKMSDDLEGLNKMFDFKVPMTSLDQAQQQIFSWAEQLRNELRRRGLTTTGMLIAPDAKSQVDDALDKLNTHFIKRQSEIRQAFINGSISSSEMNRRISANDEELLKARVELRKRLMGEASYFKQALYPELQDVDLKRITDAIGVADSEIRTELEKGLEEDKNTITEGAIKIREAIEKELMAGDPFATLRQNFKSSLDELNLLASDFERDLASSLQSTFENLEDIDSPFRLAGLDEETQRERLGFLMELSKKSYSIDRDGLREMFKSHQEYYNWVTHLDDQQMDVMLAKLQWFYDESLVKQANYRERILKGLESSYLQQEENMNEIDKLEWKLAKARSARKNLQDQNNAYDQAPGLSLIDKDQYDSNVQEIISYNQAIKKLEEELSKEQEAANRKSKDRKSKQEREANKELNAVLAALEEHYLKRKAIIQQAYLDEKISGAEMNRQIAANDEDFRNARIELRKELVGEANTFNQSLYPELKGKDIQRTAQFLQQIGDVVTDGIRKNIQKDEVEIRDGAIKIRQAFEAEMLKGDYFGSLGDNFRKSMDELKLLSSEYERNLESIFKGPAGVVEAAEIQRNALSEQGQKERLSALQGWAEKTDSMTDAMLKDMMLKEKEFSSWLGKLNDDEIQVLINKMRDYKEAYDDVVRKEGERMKKRTDAMFKATGQQDEAQDRISGAERQIESLDQLESMGVQGLEKGQYDAEIELIKRKMEYQIRWIALLQQEQQVKMENLNAEKEAAQDRLNNATNEEERKKAAIELAEVEQRIVAQTKSYNIAIADSNEKMLELQKEASNSYLKEMTRHFDTINEYTGQLDEFALAMGKGIYGSKEDRQQAAKDLLSSVATTTKNVIQQWLMELTMKKAINDMKIANDEAAAAQQTLIQYKTLQSTGALEIAGMSADAAIAEAEITADSAKATAKEAAKKGLIGLAIGAAISVALSALLGAALGRINKAKGEVAAATGASSGRLATGMLTYAEGNYPVLGNDGNVYNAKYEGAGMKTGIYRGGAHFGIFSEKKPEAIIDGDTTQRLILNHPDIWQSIVTLSKTGRLDRGMRTFASGNINELARTAQEADATATAQNNEQMMQMQATLDRNSQIMLQLTQVLNQGIHAKIDMYGDGGMYKSMKKAENFASKRGYK